MPDPVITTIAKRKSSQSPVKVPFQGPKSKIQSPRLVWRWHYNWTAHLINQTNYLDLFLRKPCWKSLHFSHIFTFAFTVLIFSKHFNFKQIFSCGVCSSVWMKCFVHTCTGVSRAEQSSSVSSCHSCHSIMTGPLLTVRRSHTNWEVTQRSISHKHELTIIDHNHLHTFSFR